MNRHVIDSDFFSSGIFRIVKKETEDESTYYDYELRYYNWKSETDLIAPLESLCRDDSHGYTQPKKPGKLLGRRMICEGHYIRVVYDLLSSLSHRHGFLSAFKAPKNYVHLTPEDVIYFDLYDYKYVGDEIRGRKIFKKDEKYLAITDHSVLPIDEIYLQQVNENKNLRLYYPHPIPEEYLRNLIYFDGKVAVYDDFSYTSIYYIERPDLIQHKALLIDGKFIDKIRRYGDELIIKFGNEYTSYNYLIIDLKRHISKISKEGILSGLVTHYVSKPKESMFSYEEKVELEDLDEDRLVKPMDKRLGKVEFSDREDRIKEEENILSYILKTQAKLRCNF